MRRLILSDTHIGDDRGDRNLASLFKVIEQSAAPDSHLILNGDIFDLASCLSMDSRHVEFIEAARLHGHVTYIQGNHDWIIKGFGDVLSKDIEFLSELRFEVGGRKFRVLHGHQYDFVANRLPRLNRFIIRLNHTIHRLSGADLQIVLRDTAIGKWMLRRQEQRLIRKEKWADVVIAGHTHNPSVTQCGKKLYINTGDWVERPNRSYAVVEEDGSVELRRLEAPAIRAP